MWESGRSCKASVWISSGWLRNALIWSEVGGWSALRFGGADSLHQSGCRGATRQGAGHVKQGRLLGEQTGHRIGLKWPESGSFSIRKGTILYSNGAWLAREYDAPTVGPVCPGVAMRSWKALALPPQARVSVVRLDVPAGRNGCPIRNNDKHPLLCAILL